MKRLHVHVSVEDLARSVRFYSTLFAAAPAVNKPDYAKWMLDDPRVNFAISTHGGAPEGATTCCHARSEKSWITDPHGVRRETFLTTGASTVYGDSIDLGAIRTVASVQPTPETQDACCEPKPEMAADVACCGS